MEWEWGTGFATLITYGSPPLCLAPAIPRIPSRLRYSVVGGAGCLVQRRPLSPLRGHLGQRACDGLALSRLAPLVAGAWSRPGTLAGRHWSPGSGGRRRRGTAPRTGPAPSCCRQPGSLNPHGRRAGRASARTAVPAGCGGRRANLHAEGRRHGERSRVSGHDAVGRARKAAGSRLHAVGCPSPNGDRPRRSSGSPSLRTAGASAAGAARSI